VEEPAFLAARMLPVMQFGGIGLQIPLSFRPQPDPERSEGYSAVEEPAFLAARMLPIVTSVDFD